jgi:hypothetical protein
MFMLYPIVLALVVGVLTGGSLAGLSSVRIRLWWLAIAGLVVQVILFSPAVTGWIGEAGAAIYVASSATVLAVVAANLRLPGAPLIGLGGLSNLLAIVANGGYMPTTADALRLSGFEPAAGYSNSRELAEPMLAPLTDIFALPAWLPSANVFSVGDVLIGIGVAWLVFRSMRDGRPGRTKVRATATADGTRGA